MTSAVFFIAIGVLLLFLLAAWCIRTGSQHMPAVEVARMEEVLSAVQLELPSRAIGERIFSQADWHFVSQCARADVQRCFLEQRKALALGWLRETSSAVKEVMNVHRRAARSNADLNPWLEFQLFLQFASFLVFCHFLTVLVRLRGPFAPRKAVGYIIGLSDQLCYISGRALASLNLAGPDRHAAPTKSIG